MKKLLSLFSSLVVMTPSAGLAIPNTNTSTNINEKVSNFNKTINDKKADIDVSEVNFSPITINVSTMYDNPFSMNSVVRAIAAEMLKQTDVEYSNLIGLSIMQNWSDDWYIGGLYESYPEPNSKLEMTGNFAPLSVEGLSGVMTVDVIYSNIPESSIDIGGALHNKEGEFVLKDRNEYDVTEEGILEEIFDTFDIPVDKLNNKPLVKDDLQIDLLTYTKVIISVKTDEQLNQRFYGTVTLTYKTLDLVFAKSDNTPPLEVKKIQVDAYNSKQEKSDEAIFQYVPVTSRLEFEEYFDTMTLDVQGYSWNNHDGDRFNDNGVEYSDEDHKKEPLSNYVTSEEIIKSQVFDRIYDGTENWMKSYGQISIFWDSNPQGKDRINILLSVQVSAYATAWNAMWARSAASLSLDSIKFNGGN